VRLRPDRRKRDRGQFAECFVPEVALGEPPLALAQPHDMAKNPSTDSGVVCCGKGVVKSQKAIRPYSETKQNEARVGVPPVDGIVHPATGLLDAKTSPLRLG